MKLLLVVVLIILHRETDAGLQRPMDLMADLTNDLGVCILQVQSTLQYGNIAFSPYGLASMSILLFEGAAGNTALEIMRVMKLPWNTLLVRVGFRDINRHLKTYFKSDGFLRGLIMSRDNVCFFPSYQKILRLYGFDEPDTALTYPCNGFVPYSPPSTEAATTEGVTISTPASNETTTLATTTSLQDVVTEITQTSQTVTINSATTSTPLDAETASAASVQVETKTESSLANKVETETASASETKLTTAFRAKEGSETTTSTTVRREATTIESVGISPMETAATSVVSRVSTSTPRQTPAAIKAKPATVTSKPVASTTMRAPMKNATAPAKNVTSSNNVYVQKVNKNDTDFGFFADGLSESGQFGGFFTNKSNFSFPTTNIQTTVDQFFNNRTLEVFTEITPFEVNLNFSTDKWQPSENFSTFPPLLFNDTLVTESFDADFNNSTFFTSLVNFIDSTTEKIKDMIGFTEKPAAVTPPPPTPNLTQKPNSKNNVPASSNSTSKPPPPPLKLNEKNVINTSRANVGDSINPRVLPKKSISESNEEVFNSPMTIPAETNTKYSVSEVLPNYRNVLSLRKSRSFSTKYDIRSIKRHKRRLVKRNAPALASAENTHNQIVGNFSEKLQQLRANLTSNVTLDKTATPHAVSTGRGGTVESFAVSLRTDSQGYLPPKGMAAAYADISDFNTDPRSLRSYGHNHFNPYDMDWFATPDQNIIKVPIFTYSAILPFAYIEELKSKVLEIPLDDSNYSLMLMLPAPQHGVSYLLNSLTRFSLRQVWEYLRPTPVFASIPKFKLISQVNLRPALYNLGMRDVFHRYRADLSTMSPDDRLYIRSIEQIVTIYVDKFPSSVYPVPEKYTERHFVASHPFLYFVIDRETGVSLVAGQLSNPSKHII